MPDERLSRAVERASRLMSTAAGDLRAEVRVREEGWVVRSGDGVVEFEGLPGVGAEELVEVGRARRSALVAALGRDRAQAILLDEPHRVREGDRVRATGRVAAIPVGEALLGRVVDPLGQPLDGQPRVETTDLLPLERAAPPIHRRSAVHTPLYTGILAVDAMFPIGRGQRELIIGDEGTGKTALGIDVLLRQAGTEVIGIYAAIGGRRAEIWAQVEVLRKGGGRWVVVATPHEASPGMRFLTPYAAMAVGEFFMDRGEHAVVVLDDLTSHANAWREVSLLMRHPPGREAYPGDIFYVHSRMLERATQLSPELGGGSLTALPVAVTESGRLSAYIPTNLISITDGQLVLDADLFAAGQKPALHAGLSVSRVGGKAQAHALRELSSRMRLEYAGFLELEVFARLGTRMGGSTERRLDIGRRLRRLLRAPQYRPLGIFDEVARLVLAASTEALLRIPEEQVPEATDDLVAHLRRELPGAETRIDEDAVLSEEDRAAMEREIEAWLDRHHPSEQEEVPGEAGEEEDG